MPRERLEEVAHHYERFGGVSPINAQNRALIAALRVELDAHGIALPIYFGNRNWDPFLTDALQEMADDGVERALAFFTSAYSSYSGCRQYRENIFNGAAGGRGPGARGRPDAHVLQPPGLDRERTPSTCAPRSPGYREARAHVAFTAHSIPLAMAQACRYEDQLRESCRLVAETVGVTDWELVWQSRSGPPQVPWLEPDILDHLGEVAARGGTDVVISPIGFVSDHLEVFYDLDVEAHDTAVALGMNLGARRERRDPSGVRRDDPRAGRGAARRSRGRGPGRSLRRKPRRVPGGLLPAGDAGSRARGRGARNVRFRRLRRDRTDLRAAARCPSTLLLPPPER